MAFSSRVPWAATIVGIASAMIFSPAKAKSPAWATLAAGGRYAWDDGLRRRPDVLERLLRGERDVLLRAPGRWPRTFYGGVGHPSMATMTPQEGWSRGALEVTKLQFGAPIRTEAFSMTPIQRADGTPLKADSASVSMTGWTSRYEFGMAVPHRNTDKGSEVMVERIFLGRNASEDAIANSLLPGSNVRMTEAFGAAEDVAKGPWNHQRRLDIDIDGPGGVQTKFQLRRHPNGRGFSIDYFGKGYSVNDFLAEGEQIVTMSAVPGPQSISIRVFTVSQDASGRDVGREVVFEAPRDGSTPPQLVRYHLLSSVDFMRVRTIEHAGNHRIDGVGDGFRGFGGASAAATGTAAGTRQQLGPAAPPNDRGGSNVSQ